MGGPDAKRVDHFNRQSQWNAALSTGKSHITYKLPWCLLFSPPCMNSAVTIHPQSIYSNISLDIVHHFCQPNVLYTLRSASPLYDMMPVVLAHTQTNMWRRWCFFEVHIDWHNPSDARTPWSLGGWNQNRENHYKAGFHLMRVLSAKVRI